MAIDIREVFFRLEAFGLYDFLLPFLLMFAVVFGILSFIGIFKEQKGLNAVIAIVLGLLAVRYSFFTDFLNEISPRLGVGLVILLALMILIGLFVPSEHMMIIGWVMVGIALIIALVIFGQVYDLFGPGGLGASSDLIAGLILVGLLIGIIVAVVSSGGKDKANNPVAAVSKALGLRY